VKIKGVARVSVSKRANCDPAAPLKTRVKTAKGLAPLKATRKPAKTRTAKIANAG
jgi:hypothetical protein